jgi:hypothetical protein
MNLSPKALWSLFATFLVILAVSAVVWRWRSTRIWDVVYDRYSNISMTSSNVNWVTLDAAQKLRFKSLDDIPSHDVVTKLTLENGVGTGRLHLKLGRGIVWATTSVTMTQYSRKWA